MSIPSGVLSIAVVCEARSDAQIAEDLADRVVCERLPVLQAHLSQVREYRGLTRSDSHLEWSQQKRLMKWSGARRFHGHFDGRPAEPDAVAGFRMLQFLDVDKDRPDVVILVRDIDKDRNRAVGLEQARSQPGWRFRIILAVANTKRECWVIAGFEPQNDLERQRLEQIRKELGYDPRPVAERLVAQDVAAKTSAKRILGFLTTNDYSRETICWRRTSLELLRKNGGGSGLRAYLLEIETHLVPLFDLDVLNLNGASPNGR